MKIHIEIECRGDDYERLAAAECEVKGAATNLLDLLNLSGMLCAGVAFQLARAEKKAKAETEVPADTAPAVTEPEGHSAPL